MSSVIFISICIIDRKDIQLYIQFLASSILYYKLIEIRAQIFMSLRNIKEPKLTSIDYLIMNAYRK